MCTFFLVFSMYHNIEIPGTLHTKLISPPGCLLPRKRTKKSCVYELFFSFHHFLITKKNFPGPPRPRVGGARTGGITFKDQKRFDISIFYLKLLLELIVLRTPTQTSVFPIIYHSGLDEKLGSNKCATKLFPRIYFAHISQAKATTTP